jgi:acyl dehydratase
MTAGNTLLFDEVRVGLDIPVLDKGRLNVAHLMRWSAAMENWHRIHYDMPFAVEREKLPGLLVNGSLKQQFIVQALKDWVGVGGWLWKVSFQFRAMNVAGECLHVWGRTTATRRCDGFGLVELEVGIRNDAGLESTPGRATVALPYSADRPVPYPFIPPQHPEAKP